MKWTSNKPPTKGISFYDHTIASTPIGDIKIEWKSWKDFPSYDIMLGDEWLGVEYDLELAKNRAEDYLKELTKKLITYLKLE